MAGEPTGCTTRCKQASNNDKQTVNDRIEVGCCKETKNRRPHDFSERYDSFLKNLCACQFLLTLAYSEKSWNACNGDTKEWWSPPSVLCKPIKPTPAMMRPNRTWWARRRQNTFGHFRKRKHLDILATPVCRPSAAKCSASDIYPPHWSKNDGLSLKRGRRR